jgi:hypothetical protein
LPGGAGWVATDAIDDLALAGDEPSVAPSPRWRYHHLVADADTDLTEKELERLSATGWEVVTFAIVARQGLLDGADSVYLLRTAVPD